MTTKQVLTAALELPDDDRVELIEALIASVQPADQPPFDEAWREVIRCRSAEPASGSVAAVPWAEVRRQAWDAGSG